jgi:ribosomal protein S21
LLDWVVLERGVAPAASRRKFVSQKVVVREGEPVEVAIRKLRRLLRGESISDRFRRRWWRVEWYQKPGYRRRQRKFFAKVVARKGEQLRQLLIRRGLA